MPCSEETLFWLFYNVSSSSLLLLLFVYFSSTLLLKLLNFIGSYPIILRNQNGYEYNFSDEEEEVDTETYYYTDPREKDHLVADIVLGGESLVFLSNTSITQRTQNHVQEFVNQRQSLKGEDNDDETSASDDEKFSVLASAGSESKYDDADPVVKEEEEEDMTTRDADSVFDSAPDHGGPTTPITTYRQKNGLMDSDKNYGEDYINQGIENKKMDTNFHGDEKFFVFAPTQFETKKLQVQEKDDEEIFGDSCTVGSTSKSSSEWRSSIKDSGTEDPFSSSSRRSCPKWESYTVFQKYDEEMTFLDRVSAQKLHETESLKSIQVNPRSISDRIVHKIATMNKKKPSDIRHNPYHELEAAYVAQICLTWEALNWNYKNFNSKRASQRDFDRGCPGHIAQQFQQFQVLLQRYVENEPYEQGRRPEVYARVRLLAPKLLLVPEYREDDTNEEGFGSRISSAAFLMIMEDGIKTFMDFLKLDKQKPCQILSSFLRRNRRGSVDPALLQLMKKVNKKKKMKLKDLRRARKCIRKRKLKVEEEMEILMGLIDLKVVSRVLRMNDLSEEQLHWCEEKMSKVRVLDGKLQRDSLPLFFPAH
ncbi:uncharacterized protein LOC110661453 isoform X3 [Hevea brasiliensis]|uniref:uncharacterized protein LOC110661453 isoform X3 n=1 Tax=Hevea brasiliensis TaxID=3981 RepID=UPI0025E23548|nr:uncharacterized protein LOC110661453 isoform X3 [Hevea brasiliensis]